MSIKGVVIAKDADVKELAARIGKDVGGVDKLATTNKKSIVDAINEVKGATVKAEEIYATKEEASKLASKVELKKAIDDLVNNADDDSDTLKELSDQIDALVETDKTLVSATEVQSFKEANKEIARNNIDAVSTINFNKAIDTLTKDKATRVELNQAKAELNSSIETNKAELQGSIKAEENARKAEGTAIRGEFTKADQDLKKAVDAADAAIRVEFAAADKSLKSAVEAADAAIRSDFTQADQTLKQAVDTADAAIRSEFAQADKVLKATADKETAERREEDTAIRNELAESNRQTEQAIEKETADRKAADAAIRNEFALADQELQKAIDSEAATRKAQDTDIRNKYATKVELTQAITDLINGADVDSDSLKELADKITALAQADKGLVSATEVQSFKEANKEVARKNIDAVSKAVFDAAVTSINDAKATRSELVDTKTELSESIKAKGVELQKVIDAEETSRKEQDTAIRAAFAHSDTMAKEALTAFVNTKETAMRSEFTKYDELLQKTIDAEEVVRKVEDASIRSEFALADQKLKENVRETINVREATIRNDFTDADRQLQTAVRTEEWARKSEDAAIRSELARGDQQVQAIVDAEVRDRKATDAIIRNEFAQADQLLQQAINAEGEARKAADTAIRNEFATKNELTQAINDLINGADVDSDTLKELADKITALAQADKGLVSATSAQAFKEANKEIARKNIDAVSKADFNEAVTTVKSDKADREELEQAQNTLAGAISAKGVELQNAINAEKSERKAQDVLIRSEFAQADKSLKEAVDAVDAAIRSELAQSSQQLQEAISAEEGARLAEGAVIRSEFAQADQKLKEAVDAEDAAIRSAFTKADQQLQTAINAEQKARQDADTAINQQIATKANKAPEGEEYALVSALPDLAPYATKDELTKAITDLINGADVDSDTLKELADKITALAQADKGLVSAANKQSFKAAEKETARKNIDAVSTAELNNAVETLSNTHSTRSELAQAKTELADSIEANASQLLEAIGVEEETRKAEDEAIRGELAKTGEQIQEAIDAIPEIDLTPFATKVELTKAVTDLINGADADSDTLKELADKITALAQTDKGLVNVTVEQEFTLEEKAQGRSNIGAASIDDLEAQKEGILGGIATAIEPLATKEELKAKADKAPEGEEYALVSSLPGLVAPYATKDELTQAVTDLINGADADSDTLKELADKITALAQADNGIVSAAKAQSFDAEQQKQARTNIAALAEEDLEFGEGYFEVFMQAFEEAMNFEAKDDQNI